MGSDRLDVSTCSWLLIAECRAWLGHISRKGGPSRSSNTRPGRAANVPRPACGATPTAATGAAPPPRSADRAPAQQADRRIGKQRSTARKASNPDEHKIPPAPDQSRSQPVAQGHDKARLANTVSPAHEHNGPTGPQ